MNVLTFLYYCKELEQLALLNLTYSYFSNVRMHVCICMYVL
jgi:hypothetical protein